jgi:hypothetical protein
MALSPVSDKLPDISWASPDGVEVVLVAQLGAELAVGSDLTQCSSRQFPPFEPLVDELLTSYDVAKHCSKAGLTFVG